MTKFEGVYLTQAGLDLSKSKGIEKIEFTKAVTGSGKYLSKNEIKDLTELKEPKQTFDLRSFSRTTTETINIQFSISNVGLIESYPLSEIGIYATGTDGVEILYCVAFAFLKNSESVPADNGIYEYMVRINIEVAVSNDVQVVIKRSDAYVDNEFDINSEYALQNKVITQAFMKIIDTSNVDKAFVKVFESIDRHSIPYDGIDEALTHPWDGSSSEDEHALSREEVYDAINIPWDGSSSEDEHALSREEISDLID